MAFFDVNRNLPHAATIAGRIERRLSRALASDDAAGLAHELAALQKTLGVYDGADDPPDAEAAEAAAAAARIARTLVDEIERLGVGEDRLGQAVRNLFECLGFAEEGAEISLRAGEDPRSLLRPV